MIILVDPGFHYLAVGHVKFSENLQAGDLPDSQDGIMKLLEEGAWGGCYELVRRDFSTSYYSWKALHF